MSLLCFAFYFLRWTIFTEPISVLDKATAGHSEYETKNAQWNKLKRTKEVFYNKDVLSE
jgi:hypothetical protein